MPGGQDGFALTVPVQGFSCFWWLVRTVQLTSLGWTSVLTGGWETTVTSQDTVQSSVLGSRVKYHRVTARVTASQVRVIIDEHEDETRRNSAVRNSDISPSL